MIKKTIFLFLLSFSGINAGYFDNVYKSFSDFIENMKLWFNGQKQEMIVSDIWLKKAHQQPVHDKIQAFKNTIVQSEKENEKIPLKTSSILRIATYNVHFWNAPGKKWDEENNQEQIFDVIKKINADILILQEVRAKKPFKTSNIAKNLQKIGYTSIAGCNTYPPEKDWFGVVIASKLSPLTQKRKEFQTQERPKKEKRCYLQSLFELRNEKKLLIYGTHLEVGKADKKDKQPASELIRKAQLEDIIKSIRYEQSQNTIDNILIAADFNSVRKQDYLYEINGKNVWDMVQTENKRIFGFYPTPTDTLDLLQNQNFIDSFSFLGWTGPKFTTWTGTVIDFLFLSPTWNLPLLGTYIYYDAASDHLPIILDINLA